MSGHSWWESNDDAYATFDSGMKGMIAANTLEIVTVEAALALPALAAQTGILIENPELFTWGMEQMGMGTLQTGMGVSKNPTSSGIYSQNSQTNSLDSSNSFSIDQNDTMKPGPFASNSIPARSPEQMFSNSERQAIDSIGFESGCHSCGSKSPGTSSGHFIPDHQPPSAINFENAPQELFPHCINCSRVQGGQVRNFLRKLDDFE